MLGNSESDEEGDIEDHEIGGNGARETVESQGKDFVLVLIEGKVRQVFADDNSGGEEEISVGFHPSEYLRDRFSLCFGSNTWSKPDQE